MRKAPKPWPALRISPTLWGIPIQMDRSLPEDSVAVIGRTGDYRCIGIKPEPVVTHEDVV